MADHSYLKSSEDSHRVLTTINDRMNAAREKNKCKVRFSYQLQRRVCGSADLCCVPRCSASSRHNSGLSFHRFPKTRSLRAQWLVNINRTGLLVTKHTKVCSRHFEEHEIIRTKGGRVLTAGSVPSLFVWNNFVSNRTLAAVWEPKPQPSSPEPEEDHGHYEPHELPVPAVQDHNYGASRTVCVDREKYEDMMREIMAYHLQSSFRLQRFASSPEDIQFYTRFPSHNHLMAFWNLIESATARMIRFNKAESYATRTTTESPSTRPIKLLPIDEFFLFLNYLSTGCTQRELGHRFNIRRATVSQIIITWANFLYSLLSPVPIWQSPAAVKASLPCDFDGIYSNTQVILDCTELRCETPLSLLLPSEDFSTDQSHCTFKAMVGMSPHGALTFVSALFEGSMSDEEVFRRSGITSLLTPDMAVMVDKGFLVDDLVPGSVHRLAFLSERTQMREVDVLKTQSIARLRVHVGRMMRRVKENKLFDTMIPLSISGSINQIFTVACLLLNFQNGPLVKKLKYEI